MSDRTVQTELPPPMVFMQLLFGKQLTYSLSGVARLGVANHMDKTAVRSRSSPPRRARMSPRSIA